MGVNDINIPDFFVPRTKPFNLGEVIATPGVALTLG